MNRIKEQAFRGLAYVGKGALFCMGVFAVLALAAATTVLVPVMLAATIMPTTGAGLRRDQSAERYAGNGLDVSAARSGEGATWQNRTE
jgi:hypothetical protein